MATQREAKFLPGLSQIEVQNFNNWPRNCRVMKFGETSMILLAHRDEVDNIVGFERMLYVEGIMFEFGIAGGGCGAVHVINDPGSTTRAIVTACGKAAFNLKLIENRCDTLYISSSGEFGLDTQRQLKILLEDKIVFCSFEGAEEGHALFADLIKIAPHAEYIGVAIPSEVQVDDPSETLNNDDLDDADMTFTM